jgi:uncharacterized membrane protein YvbJ
MKKNIMLWAGIILAVILLIIVVGKFVITAQNNKKSEGQVEIIQMVAPDATIQPEIFTVPVSMSEVQK